MRKATSEPRKQLRNYDVSLCLTFDEISPDFDYDYSNQYLIEFSANVTYPGVGSDESLDTEEEPTTVGTIKGWVANCDAVVNDGRSLVEVFDSYDQVTCNVHLVLFEGKDWRDWIETAVPDPSHVVYFNEIEFTDPVPRSIRSDVVQFVASHPIFSETAVIISCVDEDEYDELEPALTGAGFQLVPYWLEDYRYFVRRSGDRKHFLSPEPAPDAT